MINILGIGGYSHDASTALICDGKLVAAVQEERLTRIKHQGGIPYKSIRYCLKAGGIKPADVSAVAFYTKKSNWDRILWDVFKDSIKKLNYTIFNMSGFANSIGYRVYKSLNFRADLARFFYETGFSKNTFFDYDHHTCHAASGFYSSPFERAVILCLDSVGDGKTTSFFLGEGHLIKEIFPSIKYPHSIAHVYNRITKYLGFTSSGDEYKVMGLAAYGKPLYFDKLKDLVIYEKDGYRLNMKYFSYQYEYSLSKRFFKEFGAARKKEEAITAHHKNMAASMQKLFEDVLFHLASIVKNKSGFRNLVISGGAALNCKGNGKLLYRGEFDNVFVPPGASDLGTSLGAALYHYHQKLDMPRNFTLETDGLGPEYSDEEIRNALERSVLRYERIENPADTAAKLVADGNIVGWFQGRMEFGPRALGYRSILADPRRESIKDKINKTIKFREEFRPFAPSMLQEYTKEYFNKNISSPFMTFTLDITPANKENLAGVVHVDGSVRLHTVSKEDQPLYYSLIEKFYNLTGVPAVLNTSFNLMDEPIVCSPQDAIRTFFSCGMDVLVIGNYLVRKRE